MAIPSAVSGMFPTRRRIARLTIAWQAVWLATLPLAAQPPDSDSQRRPVGTATLELQGDIASEMVAGIDRFLLNQWEAAANERPITWTLDLTSEESLRKSLEPHRRRLAQTLGVVDPRLAFTPADENNPLGSRMVEPAQIQSDQRGTLRIHAIRWPVLGEPSPQLEGLPSLWGEGLLVMPRGNRPLANVIVLPDADQTPEQLSGLADGLPAGSQVAARLAAAGCRVLVPDLVSRRREPRNGRANLSDREYLQRPAFELGRTLAGYEIQIVLSLVDRMAAEADPLPTGIFGYGEGGMLGLWAAGIDPRIESVAVSGFFGPRDESWREPMERSFFGLHRDFDAAEFALLMAGRPLVIETARGPELEQPGEGGTPAILRSPDPVAAAKCLEQARQRLNGAPRETVSGWHLTSPEGGHFGATESLTQLLRGLGIDAPKWVTPTVAFAEHRPDLAARTRRRVHEMDRHTQAWLAHSPRVREQFLSNLDRSSLEAYQTSVESYRELFRDEVIGHFDIAPAAPRPRARQTWQTDNWTGYEVVLDVFPDVIAYGALLLPNDLQPGERRPVVVCQHGLEGRPVDVIQGDHPAYHDFAAKLCENGLIVFAPQNPYLFQDRFRTLQRKSQPLGKTLFSVIVPQHQAILDWLRTQPYVDPDRIAFYGLSYGGKTAMRVPALVTDYCLSICSADFNEWVLKNASTRHGFSYVWTGEYEIFEWNLGGTFNYAEMAALICPRPFMVERGHFDGVGEDHWVAHEYAKVRALYAAKLGIPQSTQIEWFKGPHTIHGQGTFSFLSHHLRWPIRPMGE